MVVKADPYDYSTDLSDVVVESSNPDKVDDEPIYSRRNRIYNNPASTELNSSFGYWVRNNAGLVKEKWHMVDRAESVSATKVVPVAVCGSKITGKGSYYSRDNPLEKFYSTDQVIELLSSTKKFENYYRPQLCLNCLKGAGLEHLLELEKEDAEDSGG
jgi:hypothetical protein